MKRIIIIIGCCGLILLFLVYSGIFRNNKDPVSVVGFYYQCMKNWEWFLAVPMHKKETFSYLKEESDYNEKKLFSLNNVKLKVVKEDADESIVSVLITYKDGHSMNATADLVKEQGRWLIKTISYE